MYLPSLSASPDQFSGSDYSESGSGSGLLVSPLIKRKGVREGEEQEQEQEDSCCY